METPKKTLSFAKSILLVAVFLVGGLVLLGMLADKKETANAEKSKPIRTAVNPNQKRDINGFRLGMPKAEVMKQVTEKFQSPCIDDKDLFGPNTVTINCPAKELNYRFTFTDKYHPPVLMEVQLIFRSETKFEDVLKDVSDQFGKQPDVVNRAKVGNVFDALTSRDSATFNLGGGDKLGLNENNVSSSIKRIWRLLLINEDLFAREKEAIEKSKRDASPTPKL